MRWLYESRVFMYCVLNMCYLKKKLKNQFISLISSKSKISTKQQSNCLAMFLSHICSNVLTPLKLPLILLFSFFFFANLSKYFFRCFTECIYHHCEIDFNKYRYINTSKIEVIILWLLSTKMD